MTHTHRIQCESSVDSKLKWKQTEGKTDTTDRITSSLTWLTIVVRNAVARCRLAYWPSWCHCHSLSLASVKSRLVLPFWYRLTWVVTEKGHLNVCVFSINTAWFPLFVASSWQLWHVNVLASASRPHYHDLGCGLKILMPRSWFRSPVFKKGFWYNINKTHKWCGQTIPQVSVVRRGQCSEHYRGQAAPTREGILHFHSHRHCPADHDISDAPNRQTTDHSISNQAE